MKRSIPVLIVIGIAAALSAAILVASLRTDTSDVDAVTEDLPREITILVASTDLDAMTVLESDAISTEVVSSDRAPAGHLTHGVEVVGKVLATPVRAGQAFTTSLFISEGTGVQLASMLADGMRAMSISLTNYSGLEGLLYPGANVDVLATFRRSRDHSSSSEPVSMSLMRSVLVLAIEDRTIVSENLKVPGLEKIKRERRRVITLMVTPKQAELLQLATEHGTISLSMRNPLDSSRARRGFTSMNELLGGPAQLSPIRLPAPPVVTTSDPSDPGMDTGPLEPLAVWSVTVIRGGVAEVHQFAQPSTGSRAQAVSR